MWDSIYGRQMNQVNHSRITVVPWIGYDVKRSTSWEVAMVFENLWLNVRVEQMISIMPGYRWMFRACIHKQSVTINNRWRNGWKAVEGAELSHGRHSQICMRIGAHSHRVQAAGLARLHCALANPKCNGCCLPIWQKWKYQAWILSFTWWQCQGQTPAAGGSDKRKVSGQGLVQGKIQANKESKNEKALRLTLKKEGSIAIGIAGKCPLGIVIRKGIGKNFRKTGKTDPISFWMCLNMGCGNSNMLVQKESAKFVTELFQNQNVVSDQQGLSRPVTLIISWNSSFEW